MSRRDGEGEINGGQNRAVMVHLETPGAWSEVAGISKMKTGVAVHAALGVGGPGGDVLALDVWMVHTDLHREGGALGDAFRPVLNADAVAE